MPLTPPNISIIETLLGTVHDLMNIEIGSEAVCEYADSAPTLLCVLLTNNGRLVDSATQKLTFIINTKGGDMVDEWIDAFSRERKEKYKLESVMQVLENTEDSLVAERVLFFINVAVNSHATLFKRKTVRARGRSHG